MTRLDHESRETVQPLHNFGNLVHHWSELFDLDVNCGRVLEGKVGRGRVALGRDVAQQRISSSIEIGFHPLHFRHVFLVRTASKAWGKAHLHFGINATGEPGVWVEILYASPHFEEVERVIHEFLRGDPSDEWPVVKCGSSESAQSRSDGSARVFVLEMQLHKWREAKSQAFLVGLRESLTQDAIQQESG